MNTTYSFFPWGMLPKVDRKMVEGKVYTEAVWRRFIDVEAWLDDLKDSEWAFHAEPGALCRASDICKLHQYSVGIRIVAPSFPNAQKHVVLVASPNLIYSALRPYWSTLSEQVILRHDDWPGEHVAGGFASLCLHLLEPRAKRALVVRDVGRLFPVIERWANECLRDDEKDEMAKRDEKNIMGEGQSELQHRQGIDVYKAMWAFPFDILLRRERSRRFSGAALFFPEQSIDDKKKDAEVRGLWQAPFDSLPEWPVRARLGFDCGSFSLKEIRDLQEGDVVMFSRASSEMVQGVQATLELGSGRLKMCEDWALLVKVTPTVNEWKITCLDVTKKDVMNEKIKRTERMLDDVPITCTLVIADIEISARKLALLAKGDVLTLEKPIASLVSLRAGHVEVAQGELVDLEGELGVRIVERA